MILCSLAALSFAQAALGRGLPLNPAAAAFETDAGTVSGVAWLDLASIDSPGAQTWAVVRIKPAADSGSGFVRDAYLNVDTGKMVYGAHPTVVERYSGTVDVLASLAGAPEASYTYHWEQPLRIIDVGPPTPPDVASYPFIIGGTFVCQIDTDLHGGKEFSPHYQIPDDWVKWAQPALAYIRAHHQMLFSPRQASDRTTLKGLTKGDNPFLAIAAFRTLTRVGEPAESLAAIALHRNGVLQGALVAVLVDAEMKRKDRKALPVVTSYIDTASAAGARAVLMGVRVANQRHWGDWMASWSPQVGQEIKKRLPSWPTDDPAAQQIRAVLGP
jgi:hypothetical protein